MTLQPVDSQNYARWSIFAVTNIAPVPLPPSALVNA